MIRTLQASLVVALVAALSGCYTIDQTTEIHEDLTITSTVTMSIDMAMMDDVFSDDMFGDDVFGDDLFGDDLFGEDPWGEDARGDDTWGEIPDDAWQWSEEEWEAYFDSLYGSPAWEADQPSRLMSGSDGAPPLQSTQQSLNDIPAEFEELLGSDEDIAKMREILGDRLTIEYTQDGTVHTVFMRTERVTQEEMRQIDALPSNADASSYGVSKNGSQITFTIAGGDLTEAELSEARMVMNFVDFTDVVIMPGAIVSHSHGTVDPSDPTRISLSVEDRYDADPVVIVADLGGSWFSQYWWAALAGLLLIVLVLGGLIWGLVWLSKSNSAGAGVAPVDG